MPLTPRCCQGCRESTDVGGHSGVKRGLGPAPTKEAAGTGQPLAHRGVGMGARGEVTLVAVKHSKWKTDAQMLPQGLAGNSSAWAQGCGVHANSVSICSRAGWTRCSCPLPITTRAAPRAVFVLSALIPSCLPGEGCSTALLACGHSPPWAAGSWARAALLMDALTHWALCPVGRW